MSIASVRSRPVFPSLDAFTWPGDFARIPDEEWTRQPNTMELGGFNSAWLRDLVF